MSKTCPSSNELRALFDGCISEAVAVRLGAHVDECAACRDTLQHMTSEVKGLGVCARNGRAKTMVVEDALREAMDHLKEAPLATAEFPEDEAEDFAVNILKPSDKAGILGLLGSYEILEIIGTGGMGRVYKALDPTLNRFVAIKLIAPQLSTSKGARKRFAREARAAAAINHENVVQIYGVPEVDGIPYLVMEYVPGISLQQKVDKREPIELKEILRIGQQTAAGLAAAHAQGLIHRDIKPPNILLEHGQDRVKITDFGLARMVDDASLTQSGVLAGTPQYMAPEQARGEAQDHRVDLFSLGSVLYTLCTGTPPFRANTTMAVLRQVSDQQAQPIRELNPRIPAWLCAIVAKLHEKDPNDRFQSAKGVADMLGQCLAHVQDPVRFSLPVWQEKRSILGTRFLKPTSRAAILGFMVALVGAVGFWQGWQAISHYRTLRLEFAVGPPEASSGIPAGDDGMATSDELAQAGLDDKVIAATAVERLLREKRALEVKVAELRAQVERVANQLATSKTSLGGNQGSKITVANRTPERQATPSGLKLPHEHDIKAVALSPDGLRIAVAENDDRIHTYVISGKKTAEFWMAALPEEYDPLQIRVRELQKRYELVRKEIPQDVEKGMWEDALSKTLQEYLERMPRVMSQRQKLDELQTDLDLVTSTHDGKGFAEIGHRLNRGLDEARKELESLRQRLRSGLRRDVMRHMQTNLSEAKGFDPEQLAAINALIKSVNLEAQSRRLKPSSLLGEWQNWMGEIREETSFPTKCKSISGLEYAAGGALLIGSGAGPDLFVWNARTGHEVSRLSGSEKSITKFAVCAQSGQVISIGADANVCLWTPVSQEGAAPEERNWQPGIRDLAIASSGEWITFLTKSGQLRAGKLLDGSDFSKSWETGGMHQTKALAVTPDQRLAACLIGENTVKIFNGRTGAEIHSLKPTNSQCTCIAFVPQSDSLVIGSKDGALYYYDTQTWRQQGYLRLESSWPVSFSVAPNSSLIGVRQKNGQAFLAPISVQTSAATLPSYSSVEIGELFPTWFEPACERLIR